MSGITSSPYTWVSACGWISEEEKLRLLQSASLLLVPSAFEGQPLVVLEAMSSGLPVLVSDRLLSMPEGVEVAPFEDTEHWVEKVLQMFENPPLSSQLVAQSKPYQIHAVARRWSEIYTSPSLIE